jgi:hypothetical protein
LLLLLLGLALGASVHPHDAQNDGTQQTVLHGAREQEPTGTSYQRRHDVGLPAVRLDVGDVGSGDVVAGEVCSWKRFRIVLHSISAKKVIQL